jgi:hypothetical protein
VSLFCVFVLFRVVCHSMKTGMLIVDLFCYYTLFLNHSVFQASLYFNDVFVNTKTENILKGCA